MTLYKIAEIIGESGLLDCTFDEINDKDSIMYRRLGLIAGACRNVGSKLKTINTDNWLYEKPEDIFAYIKMHTPSSSKNPADYAIAITLLPILNCKINGINPDGYIPELESNKGLNPYLRQKIAMPENPLMRTAWLLLAGGGCGYCKSCCNKLPCEEFKHESCTENIADYLSSIVHENDMEKLLQKGEQDAR